MGPDVANKLYGKDLRPLQGPAAVGLRGIFPTWVNIP